MKISTRGRYGIKAMLDIAMNTTKDTCVPLKNIAKRQGIPENYLEQLMNILRKEELVRSIRGVQGGYTLNKDAEDISIGDLIKALEGNLAITDCAENKTPRKKCGTADCSKCQVKSTWKLISDKFAETVNSITLADLVKANVKEDIL